MEGTYRNVLSRAQHGALPDRIGRVTFYVVMWLAVLWSNGIGPVFFPREYFELSYCGGSIGLGLIAWAIFAWLKRRQAVLPSNPACPN